MTSIELLCDVEVLQILVISPDLDWVSGAFEVMTPFFETTDDRKHLCVVDLIVAFNWGEALREECNRMPFVVFPRLLGEDRAGCETRCVRFKSKGEVGVREDEDWS